MAVSGGILYFVTSSVLFWTICKAADISYHVLEEKPASTYIGNVANDTNLQSVIGDLSNSNMRFTLSNSNNGYAEYFTVDESTSELRTSQVLDREILCAYLVSCKLPVKVVAQNILGAFFQILSINIYLDDINDHAPEFEETSFSKKLSEKVLPGTSVTIKGAHDRDTSRNFSLKYYELESSDLSLDEELPFTITYGNVLDGSSEIQLEVTQKLDYERRTQYQMEIVAKDGDTPPKVGRLPVTILVQDENDNRPIFTLPSFNVTVSEETKVGSVIIKVSATDEDSGPNGEVRYQFSRHQASEIFEQFSIGETSGEVTLEKVIQYTPGKVFRIITEAYDTPVSGQAFTVQTFVVVTVENSANNAPEITVNLLTDRDVATVRELANIGTVVAHIEVTDHDFGTQGITGCIIQSEYFDLRRHKENDFKVTVARHLDAEKNSRHNVTVHCQDNGSPPLQTSTWFEVEVTDENDNPPQFARTFYSAQIPENSPLDTSVLKVNVTDLDQGENAAVHFVVSSNAASKFYVENSTGILRVAGNLDRETKSSYVFMIMGVDNGSSPLSGSTTVSILLTDVNDNKPNFTKTEFVLGVLENLPADTDVGRVTALDSDKGLNALKTFKLDPTYKGKVPFVVFSDGLIKTDRELDREAMDKYNFKVVATDKGEPPLNNSVDVIVEVYDDNDNDPEIIFPRDGNNSMTVLKSTPKWHVVAWILAEDPDEENNGNSRLRYQIAGRNDSNAFQINPSTGEIKVRKSLENVDVNTIFKLDIFVSDYGTPAERTAIAPLWVFVNARNVTEVEPSDELSNRNLIIAIVVGSVTVAISVAIIAVICIVRKIDFQRKPDRHVNGETELEHKVFDGSITVFSLPSEDSLLGEKKKKEVSFSLEEDVFSDDDLLHKHGHDQLKNMKPSLAYLAPKKVEDNHSETSGDTGTSDSGRGGSDEEIHNSFSTHSPRDKAPDLISVNRSIPMMPPQEIIPFSFKKGLSIPSLQNDLDRTRNKAVLLQTDSGIHSDTNSNEDEHHVDISRDFMV